MNYVSQFSRTNSRKFILAYQGQKFWNTLPVELKDESSKNVFKKNLGRFLVQQADLSLISSIMLINNFLYSLVFSLFSSLIRVRVRVSLTLTLTIRINF